MLHNLINNLLNITSILAIFFAFYFSFKLKFSHILGIKELFKKKHNTNEASIMSFPIFASILGGNLGTGNIAGTAIALSMGGMGSLSWMIIICMMTSVIRYISTFIGIKTRIHKDNSYHGGPMYYIKSPQLKIIYSISLILGAITIGNITQSNSLSLPILSMGISPILYSGAMMIFVYFVLNGNIKRFVNLSSKMVPWMSFVYLLMCFIVIIKNYHMIIPAIDACISGMFTNNSLLGGTFGNIINVAMSRAIFATDTGLGLESIMHSKVSHKTSNKLARQQGLISVISPFIVSLICLVTGFTIYTSGIFHSPFKNLESTNLCFKAFEIGLNWNLASYLLTAILLLFAFTTMLTWVFCGEASIVYLMRNNSKFINFAKKLWHVIFILFIPLGAFMDVQTVWYVADFIVIIMLLSNLISLYFDHRKSI
ncbi:MAG: alanine:cation symporter family protein [Anaplasmataceae bacterium]|nr:alanine:cation symporter family protein [Anaplasmataceae bacterium]